MLKIVAIWVTRNFASGCHSGVKVNHSRHTKQLIWDGAFLTTRPNRAPGVVYLGRGYATKRAHLLRLSRGGQP